MSSKSHSADGTTPEMCDVYPSLDFSVVSGVNEGEGISGADCSVVGDVYQFSSQAKPFEFGVGEAGDRDGESDHHLGQLGDGFEFDSRLTFMGDDGSKTEILIVHEEGGNGGDHGEAQDYCLPLDPLKPGIDYTLIKADEDPGEFHFSDYSCVCFARGTLIKMADGTQMPIEHITEGDLVLTRDRGAQPVRWIGGRTVPAHGHLAPVVITKGALDNTDDLIVSQQHRLLISDWRAEVMLGSHEVLVKARDMLNGDTIYLRRGGVVEYFHILFQSHEIIYAEGIPSESLHINRSTLDSLAEESRAEIIELFPHLAREPQNSAVASRMSLKSYEASALLRQVGFR